MSISRTAAKVAGVTLSLAFAAGCSNGSQAGLTPAGSSMQSSVRGAMSHPKSGAVHDVATSQHSQVRSWMTPDKKKKPYLYISDYGASALYVYKWPSLTPVGTVTTGLSNPDGICNDKKGNIYVANNTGQSIVEYKHGGTSPIKTLSDPNYYPVGCSVDTVTGNLAVSNIFATTGGGGTVAVYTGAKGSPTLYTDSQLSSVYFVGYDNKGNLFADGFNPGGTFQLAELPKGSGTFTNITLTGGSITFPGNIRWDGSHVAVGDQEYGGGAASAIVQTTGAGGAITGTTVLGSAIDVVGFSIYKGNTAIGPDAGNLVTYLYKYPAGGSPTNTVSGSSSPYGSAISK